MDLRNCRRCGKLFNFKGHNVCLGCLVKDEEDYLKVREYIETHSKPTVMEISQETGVDSSTINRFLREGRLAAEGIAINNGFLKCELCGASIKQGRYCDKCAKRMQKEIRGVTEDRVIKSIEIKARVHTMDSFRKD